MNDHDPTSDHEGSNLSARDLDRALAFIDGALPTAEAERFLAELPVANRAQLRAMRDDAHALRSMRAPLAPDELHEAIMSAAERVELFAGAPGVFALSASRTLSRGNDVVARPWSIRWGTAASVAAALVMTAGVGWAVWPRPTPHVSGPRNEVAIAPVGYSPDHAPYAVVLEYDDLNDAEAALRSVMAETPGAHLTCCCRGECSEVVEGPPHLVGEAGQASELVALGDIPSHQLVIPASELSRILGTFVGSGNGSVEQRRVTAQRLPVSASGTVELPIFIVPSTR